ncbi:MAG TPA: ATP-binding protein, partial [Nitrospiria bacterium]|nr:ATP-binding protein [Nitrospiria bacterium]
TDDILNYLKINGIWKGEIDNVRKDGVLFTTRAYITSLEISNKHYWVSVQEDVTERKRSEEELLRARKLESVGLLAGGIAHDFNNILTAILGNISLAKTALDPANPLCKRLNEAERATLRAKELSRQLLTFARGGAPVKKIASIAELLKDSAGFALRGSNVRSEFLLSDDLWPVEIDEGQINQVVHNLVINAQQAMPQGGMVRISAKNMNLGKQSGIPVKGGSYVEIKIEDSGTGIPAQIIDKIFDPYFTTKQKGSGLGLSTSYSIVKKHGGHIAVLSRMGEGSSFSLYLPASPGSAQLRRNVEEKPLTGSGRILLMDDEESVLETAGEMLRHLGYEVDLAKDGLEAIALYKKAMAALRPYRAVIVDLTIPGGMGGEETISSLLKVDPGVRAVVSSGYSNDPVMADFQSYGFADFIAKPYRIEEIGRVLNKVLRDKRV